jgi:DNA-binding IscR family transcriptional regulator
MKLTTKGRYGLAVVVLLNKNKGKTVSLLSISDLICFEIASNRCLNQRTNRRLFD